MTAKAEVLPRYIFRRGGMLYLKLQPPGGKLVEKSLGTSDVHDALERAREPIKAHERFMYQRRQQRVARIVHGAWAPIYPPGRFTMPDGRTGVATTDDLTFDDGITPRQPNGGPVIYLQDPQL